MHYGCVFLSQWRRQLVAGYRGGQENRSLDYHGPLAIHFGGLQLVKRMLGSLLARTVHIVPKGVINQEDKWPP